MNYYTIPLELNAIMKGAIRDDELELRTAIHQNIRLILRSFMLSYRFDANFGSILNKYQANTPPQKKAQRIWEDEIRAAVQKNLKAMLTQYEQRVEVKDVVVLLEAGKRADEHDLLNAKIQISGNIAIGRKSKFHYPDSEIAEEAQEVFPLLIPVGRVSKK